MEGGCKGSCREVATWNWLRRRLEDDGSLSRPASHCPLHPPFATFASPLHFLRMLSKPTVQRPKLDLWFLTELVTEEKIKELRTHDQAIETGLTGFGLFSSQGHIHIPNSVFYPKSCFSSHHSTVEKCLLEINHLLDICHLLDIPHLNIRLVVEI